MKRFLTVCIILAVSIGFIWANGAKEDTDKPIIEISVGSTEEGQISLYQEIFSELVQEYNELNGTEYELNLLGGQGKDITNTRMSSRDKSDIFTLDSPADVNQYAKDGLLYDMTEYAEAYAWKDQLFDWAYKLSIADNKIVTLPFGYEGMVIWYNKNIMKELGIDASVMDTLEEFELALQKADNAGYIPIMLGTQEWPWAQEWYLSILLSYTGRDLLKNTLTGTDSIGWENEAFKKTIELYKSWHDKGYLADGKSYVLTTGDAINAFTNDKALFKLEGTWAPYWLTPLDQADQEKVGVMLHPAINKIEQPHLPLAVGSMWCVSADTVNQDISAYLLSGLLQQKYQRGFLRESLDVAPIAIDDEQYIDLLPVVQEMWSMINRALDEGSFGYTSWAFYPPETRVYLYEGIVNVLEDSITIDEYLEEMQRLNEKELAAGFTPVIP